MSKYWLKLITILFILNFINYFSFSNKITEDDRAYKDVYNKIILAERKGNFRNALALSAKLYKQHYKQLSLKIKKNIINNIIDNSLRTGNMTIFKQNIYKNTRKNSVYKKLPDFINVISKNKRCEILLKENKIICETQLGYLTLSLSSNIDAFITLSASSARRVTNMKILGSYWEKDKKSKLFTKYTIALIKRLNIGSCIIENVFVKISSHLDDTIGFGLLKSFNLTIDYPNEKLILNEETQEKYKDKFFFNIFNRGGIQIIADIFNFGIKTNITINLSEGNNILSFDIFNKRFVKEEFFQRQFFFYNNEIVSGLHYSDFDFRMGETAFYNVPFFILTKQVQNKVEKINQLSRSFWKHCVIKFDFKNNRYSLLNRKKEVDYLENLLSQNELSELLKKTNDIVADKKDIKMALLRFFALFRMENYDECEMVLDNIVNFYQTNNYDIDDFLYMTIYLYLLLTERSPTMKRLKKSNNYIINYPKIRDTTEGILLKYIYKNNIRYNKVEGCSGLVKYKVRFEKILPQVTINNKKIDSLIFDTGAPLTIIAKGLAKRLKIKIIGEKIIPITSSFRKGIPKYLDLGFIDKLQLGGIEINNVYCAIANKNTLGDIEGILGSELSSILNYIINDKNHTIYFNKRKNKFISSSKDRQNLYLINNTPFLKIQLPEISKDKFIDVLLDTGNDYSFGTYPLLFENGVDISSKKITYQASLDVLGIELYSVISYPTAIKFLNGNPLSETTINMKYFFFRTGPTFHFLEVIKNYGNLGYNFIKNRILYLNFDKRQAILKE